MLVLESNVYTSSDWTMPLASTDMPLRLYPSFIYQFQLLFNNVTLVSNPGPPPRFHVSQECSPLQLTKGQRPQLAFEVAVKMQLLLDSEHAPSSFIHS